MVNQIQPIKQHFEKPTPRDQHGAVDRLHPLCVEPKETGVPQSASGQPISLISTGGASGAPGHNRRCHVTPQRSINIAGWVFSILIHGIVAGTFLLVTSSGQIKDPITQSPPSALVESETQSQPLDPIITDLKIEPLTLQEPVSASAQNIPTPVSPGPLLTDDVAAIAVENIAELSSPVVPVARNNYRGELPPVTGDAGVSAGGVGKGESPNIYYSRFCGSSGNTACVCYVVDCSGSMVIAFDYIRQELKRAIAQLTPAQNFHIIFFAGDQPIQLPQGRLLRATTDNKTAARRFVEQTNLTEVQTSDAAWQGVVHALQAAFALHDGKGRHVDLVYLLTDGDFEHSQVREAIRTLQAAGGAPVRINIIACGNRDNEDYLSGLAKANNGQYTFLSDEDLAQGQQPWP
jgi:hypothetical protein